MARPLSEEKRKAILYAAVEVMAELGESAPTAKIAKAAGVAEGTLFTYFSTKDELLNQLYLTLTTEFHKAILACLPRDNDLKSVLRTAWTTYINWALKNPEKLQVYRQLHVSTHVTHENRIAGLEAYFWVLLLIFEHIKDGTLEDRTPAFIYAMMGSLAKATIEVIHCDLSPKDELIISGFEAFWNGIRKQKGENK